ncbi:MAG: cytochrome c-type biogenesis protein [Rhizomicrobium sp.]
MNRDFFAPEWFAAMLASRSPPSRAMHIRALFSLIFSVAVIASTGMSLASTGPDALADPRLEARAVALQKELRCVQCQSESLDESSAPLAQDLRRLIRVQIANGESDDQIKKYLVARYGEFILMKPPLEPATFALWFGPLIILMVGGLGAGIFVLRARARMRQAA